MAIATITLEDTSDGKMNVGVDFGEKFDDASQAHQSAQVLLQSVLTSAKSYTQVEDTAPECAVEPSRIIVPGAH